MRLSEIITSYVSEEQDKLFFFNQKYLLQYLLQYHAGSSLEAKKTVPGASYYAKVINFFNFHYRVGELFMEYIKFSCKEKECEFCLSWSGVPVEKVPQPVPDPTRPGHYMNVSATPSLTDGVERAVDDWLPRGNISKLFNSGELSIKKDDKRQSLQINLLLRESMLGELGKLKVVELDKYLDQHKLNKKGRKRDKLDSITADVLRKKQQNVIEEATEQMVNQDESGDGSDDDDLVVEEIGTESSTSSEVESEAPAVDPLPLIVRTRYGRGAWHWNLFQMN
ncbi:Transient receptor potential cation channel subfamily A member 1 [Paramuricea clavata]|uniref:Transient receptor potential cation channel subfamily A member 1 n=1 Tax=Paramuricea clavata TaxID=317549 RepID=A0A7D9DPC7_PARCT|nr:Transient receptor potential cation channel subfamily A member 1 [Paramuricea clavata]